MSILVRCKKCRKYYGWDAIYDQRPVSGEEVIANILSKNNVFDSYICKDCRGVIGVIFDKDPSLKDKI